MAVEVVGVVHAGMYSRPGTPNGELCTRGRALLREYCIERGVPYGECGKLVVAVEAAELDRFDALEGTARENGVPGLQRIGGSGPHRRRAVRRRAAAGIDVETPGGSFRFDRHVVCAGLQSDRVSRLADGVDGPRIVPFRGEYPAVVPGKRDRVRGMIHPVPDPRYPFLGVHVTRRVSAEVEVGPNAVLSLRRERYDRRSAVARDVRELASWPGFWRLARAHWRTGLTELRGSLSITAYREGASRYVPSIGADVVRAGAGERAQAVDRDGPLVDDFRIGHEDDIPRVRNAPSPAATSSLAIAEHVVDRMDRGA